MIQFLDIWAHANRWHDRVIENWVTAGGMLLLTILLPPFPGAMLVSAVSMIAATAGAGVPVRVVAKAMFGPCLFLAVGAVPMLLTMNYSDSTGFAIEFSPAGWVMASTTGLRSLGAVSALIFLAVTTPVSSQLGILRRLGMPNFLMDMMFLTYRLLFLFDSSLQRMITAQAGRCGFRNLRTSYRSISLAVANLFSQTLARAQAMERGLASRGYDGNLQVLDHFSQPNALRLVRIIMGQILMVLICIIWKETSHG